MAEKNMKKLVINGNEYVLVDGGARTLITSIQGNVTTLQGKMTTAESKITTAESKITTLESDLETLDTKVDNLPNVEAEEKLTISLMEV